MKKFLTSIIAVLFVVCGTMKVQAATSLENMLKELNVPAADAKVMTDYIVANNISDATVDALTADVQSVLTLIGDSSLFDLDADTQALIQTKVMNAAASIGVTVNIDGAKVSVVKSNGEKLVSLTTDVVEEIANTTKERLGEQPNLLSDLSKQYKEERTLYHNNRPGNNAGSNNTTNGTTATTPNQLNQTGFNGMLVVAGLAVITLGAGLVVVNRKINA